MSEWNAEAAEWYAEKYGEYATNRLGVELLDLKAGMTVVDIGCGTGAALRHASERVTQGWLIGIDPIDRMLEIAREHTRGHCGERRIEFRRGAARSLPVEDSSADFVFAFDSYDHWEDHAAGLAEVKRVLKPDGRLVVVKDHASPGGRAGQTSFVKACSAHALTIESKQDVDDEAASFTIWICRPDGS